MWFNRKAKKEELTEKEVFQVKKMLKEERDKKFETVLKALFSNNKMSKKVSYWGNGETYCIENIQFCPYVVWIDNYDFNEEDSKILRKMAECRWLYGSKNEQSKKNRIRN